VLASSTVAAERKQWLGDHIDGTHAAVDGLGAPQGAAIVECRVREDKRRLARSRARIAEANQVAAGGEVREVIVFDHATTPIALAALPLMLFFFHSGRPLWRKPFIPSEIAPKPTKTIMMRVIVPMRYPKGDLKRSSMSGLKRFSMSGLGFGWRRGTRAP
jgi:hypothetical protein